MIAGESLGSSILPKDAVRLLYDIGVHVVLVVFNETNKPVADVVRNEENIYKFRSGDSLSTLWKSLCRFFKRGMHICQS